MSLLKNEIEEMTDISDEVIAQNFIAGATGMANAYLNAALAASTPELRAMFENSLTQVLTGHTQLSKLAAQEGWDSPYAPPKQQLSGALDKSKIFIDTEDNNS
ncbi:MAG: spore coat protein [bacterium]